VRQFATENPKLALLAGVLALYSISHMSEDEQKEFVGELQKKMPDVGKEAVEFAMRILQDASKQVV